MPLLILAHVEELVENMQKFDGEKMPHMNRKQRIKIHSKVKMCEKARGRILGGFEEF